VTAVEISLAASTARSGDRKVSRKNQNEARIELDVNLCRVSVLVQVCSLES
jgi:hypothetical protein